MLASECVGEVVHHQRDFMGYEKKTFEMIFTVFHCNNFKTVLTISLLYYFSVHVMTRKVLELVPIFFPQN